MTVEKLTRIFVLFILCGVLNTSAWACSDPPREYFLYPIQLLRESSTVLLVKAVKKEIIPSPWTPRPTFEKVQFVVVEKLFGSDIKEPIELKGIISESGSSHFNNHDAPEFWADPFSGSGGTIGDCYAYGIYEIGKTYLVFLDVGNTKAFEEINDLEADRWLALVRYLIDEERTRNKKRN